METSSGSGGLRLLWQIAQNSTPITILVLVLLFGLQTNYLLKQQDRERESKSELVRLLLAEQAAHLALAMRCARIDGVPREEGKH